MTQEEVDVVAAMEELVVIVRERVRIAPVLILGMIIVELRLTIVAILGVLRSIGEPDRVVILIAPAVTELRAEGDMLPRLPVQTCVVILTETLLHTISGIQTDERILQCGRTVLLIIISIRQWRHRTEANSVGHNRVGGIALIALGTTTQTVNLRISQTSVEIKAQPLVQFCIELGTDIVFLVTGATHDAVLIIVSIADIVLDVF